MMLLLLLLLLLLPVLQLLLLPMLLLRLELRLELLLLPREQFHGSGLVPLSLIIPSSAAAADELLLDELLAIRHVGRGHARHHHNAVVGARDVHAALRDPDPGRCLNLEGRQGGPPWPQNGPDLAVRDCHLEGYHGMGLRGRLRWRLGHWRMK